MKGKNSAWYNAKQGEGLVKVTTRARGQKPRYWSLLFCQLAQSTLPTYSNKIEILSFSELCLETNCSGDKCQTSCGNVLRLRVHLLFIPSHTHILRALTVSQELLTTLVMYRITHTPALQELRVQWKQTGGLKISSSIEQCFKLCSVAGRAWGNTGCLFN